MNPRPQSPLIPVEVLARAALLQAAIQAMEAIAPSLEALPLQELRGLIEGGTGPDPEFLIGKLIEAERLEEAVDLLRTSRQGATTPSPLCEALLARLAPLALKARQRRSATWSMDSRRTLIRLQFAKEEPALAFDDGAIRSLFLRAFRLEGLALALDLAKRPRPLLTTGLPLPAKVGGQAEFMDAVLKVEPWEAPVVLMARLNQRLPDGLHIQQWNQLPDYAAPVGDLALGSHWCWPVPADLRGPTAERVAAFLATEARPWDRDGTKAEAPLELRTIVQELRWEEVALCFSTGMGPFSALNPVKVLGAILALEPESIQGLFRRGIDLRKDARLDQAERFEPKLKNMYEDAVLLSGGSNIVLVEDDDDEPIRLG